MTVYTERFVTLASSWVPSFYSPKTDNTDEFVEQMFSEISAYCKKEKSTNTSKIYGQIALPNGKKFPNENSVFANGELYKKRSWLLKRVAKHNSSFSENPRAQANRKTFISRMWYITYVTLLIAGGGPETYNATLARDAINNSTQIIFSDHFDGQARELFRFLSEPILSLKKDYKLFDEKNQLISDQAAFLLFGSSSESRKLTPLEKRVWPNTVFQGDLYFFCAKEIVAEVMHLPLMHHYLSDPRFLRSRDELLSIFKAIVKKVEADDKGNIKVSVGSLVSSLIKWVKDEVAKVCKETENTILDTLYLLSYLARVATENEMQRSDFTFTVDSLDIKEMKEHLKIGNTLNSNDIDLMIVQNVTQLLESLSNEEIHQRGTCLIYKVPTGGYQFASKPLRLSLLGFDIARRVNESAVYSNDVFNTLKYFSHISEKGVGDYVKIDTYYDELCVLSSSVLLHLREDLCKRFLEDLCQQAKSFSVSERHQQICSIYALTEALYEDDIHMSYDTRKKVFNATFGHTLYALQRSEWRYIRETSAYYKNEIRNSFNNAVTVGDNGYLLGQPHFFFLFHEVDKKNDYDRATQFVELQQAEEKAYYFRNLTWANACLSKSDQQNLASLPKELSKLTKRNIDHKGVDKCSYEEKARLSYAIQAFLYTLSNILMCNRSAVLPEINEYDLYEMMFFSDYFLRKHNPSYQAYCQNNLIGFSKEEIELYLICGAFRFTSAMKPCATFKMSNEMINEYSRYLLSERGRYKFLLARMLSFSDFFGTLEKPARKDLLPNLDVFSSLSDNHFLPYDNIVMKAIKDNPTDPSKWYA